MTTAPQKINYERFVPQGSASLIADAPGWYGNQDDVKRESTVLPTNDENDDTKSSQSKSSFSGPICWKCRGTGVTKVKKSKHSSVPITQKIKANSPVSCTECPVCDGRGKLQPKRADVLGKQHPGAVTRARKCEAGWNVKGPLPYSLRSGSQECLWKLLVRRANDGEFVQITEHPYETENTTIAPYTDDNADHTGATGTIHHKPPSWVPRAGEELCNLVGSWRILQRVGSHRWTTDDLVTAYVAARESTHHAVKHYLDLGTGNASVLQMVTWALLTRKNKTVHSIGIEARTEALSLARRSVAFNVGDEEEQALPSSPQQQQAIATIQVIHGDFRDVVVSFEFSKRPKFDLITGTPPYFRVDFDVSSSKNNTNGKEGSTNDDLFVQTAIIRQGGMPTALQSAPARCEFRGGIEAYCQAASSVLRTSGKFVVCENWQNHHRVLQGGEQAGLDLIKMVRVQGREGKGTLFCVYVFLKRVVLVVGDGKSEATQSKDVKEEMLTVRDLNGKWTAQYSNTVLEYMSIPVPPSPSSNENTLQ